MTDQIHRLTAELDRTVTELRQAREAAAVADARLAAVTAQLTAPPTDSTDVAARLRPLAGCPLPFVIDDRLRPAARLERGASPHRVFVCSLPKAGTYLLAELLAELGSVPTGLHLSFGGLSDYRRATPAEQRAEHERYAVAAPLDQSARLVAPGQFAVGHLECTAAVKAALGPARIVFAVRDVRDGMISFMRFAADTGRYPNLLGPWTKAEDPRQKLIGFLESGAGKLYLGLCRPMAAWQREPGALTVRFEGLYGDRGEAEQAELVRRLAKLLDRPVPADPLALVHKVLGRPTKTWSGGRSDRSAYWSPEAEARFADLGGVELNRELGYT
jgi:hypothetical protein